MICWNILKLLLSNKEHHRFLISQSNFNIFLIIIILIITLISILFSKSNNFFYKRFIPTMKASSTLIWWRLIQFDISSKFSWLVGLLLLPRPMLFVTRCALFIPMLFTWFSHWVHVVFTMHNNITPFKVLFSKTTKVFQLSRNVLNTNNISNSSSSQLHYSQHKLT